MNEQEVRGLLDRIEALEHKNASLEEKVISLEKEVDTINKFVSAITESQSIETAMSEIESVTKQLTGCDKAAFYCYDNTSDKFFSQNDHRNWQNSKAADVLKKIFVGQETQFRDKTAFIPLVTSKGNSMGVIVAQKEKGFNKNDFEGFKKGSQIINTVELALKKEFEHQGRISDELTGLKNRQGLNEYITDTLCGSLQEGKNVSVVMCDIDHFKDVNDTYGHEAGDTVLRNVAAILNEGTRNGADCAFRFGGEEMVCILNCEYDKAVAAAERLREQIENAVHNVSLNGEPQEIKVTVSMGVCDIRTYGDISQENVKAIFEDDLNRADKSLYRAKDSGRNQVAVYDDNIYKSYLALRTAEILCGDNPDKAKDSILACLNSKSSEEFYSVIDALQDFSEKNPQLSEKTDSLISAICNKCGYDTPERENTPIELSTADIEEITDNAAFHENVMNEQVQQTAEPTAKKPPAFYNKNEYLKISNKTYISADAKTAYEISKYAEKQGVQFSAKYDGKNSVVTVDGVKNKGFLETVSKMSKWSDKVQVKAAQSRAERQNKTYDRNKGR